MGVPGPTELIILLVIILLLFGAKRIPELAKGLGSGMREFRKSSSSDYDEVEENKKEEKLTAGGGDEDEEDDLNADSPTEADREEQRQR